ncbi:MAG: hypothetical protein RR490_00620 [Niameybacter sp.]
MDGVYIRTYISGIPLMTSTDMPSGNSGARLGCGNIYAYAVPILETYMK